MAEPREETLLAIDTATTVLSIAVVRGRPGRFSTLAAVAHGPPGPSNSVLLPTAIDPVLRAAGVTQAELTGLVVGLGPGAFTGLRVSLATLKAISYARRLPLVGASSPHALALAAARLVPEAASVVAMLDARKGQVYAGLYVRRGDALAPFGPEPELAIDPGELPARLAALPTPWLLVGEGYERFREALDSATAGRTVSPPGPLPRTPDAASLAALLPGPLPPFDASATAGLEPNYVRPSEAEARAIAATGAPVL